MIEKQIAAEKATEFISNNMIIGLGTGSTAFYFIKKVGELIKKGLKVTAVSTSNSTTSLALSLNIPLIPIEEIDHIDLTVDGADEVDNYFNGIKGGGGALLYEKIVHSISKKVIWVVDSSKMVKSLGVFPLPVEIATFGYLQTQKKLEAEGFKNSLRLKNGEIFKSDGNNFIVDIHFEKIEKPEETEKKIKLFTGVIESGLFINTPDKVIVGFKNEARVLENNSRTL